MWYLISVHDAWRLLNHHILRDDLSLLAEAVMKVMGPVKSTYKRPPEQRWMVDVPGEEKDFSNLLREGLAMNLAVMGVHGGPAVSGNGMVGRVIRDLLRKANGDWRIWASLGENCPCFAEAAVREWAPGETPPATWEERARTTSQVVTWMVDDAGPSGRRWTDLIERLDRLPAGDRDYVMTALENLDRGECNEDASAAIWQAVRSTLDRHRRYKTARWAMPEADLTRLQGVLDRLRPSDPATRFGWLFADVVPREEKQIEGRGGRIRGGRTVGSCQTRRSGRAARRPGIRRRQHAQQAGGRPFRAASVPGARGDSARPVRARICVGPLSCAWQVVG